MKVTVCELDNRAGQIGPALEALAAHTAAAGSEFLLLPEMGLYPWLAADREVDAGKWQAAVDAHARASEDFARFAVPAIVGTRPVVTRAGERRNRAFLWQAEGALRGIHDKYYLPDEPGYWEASWYARGEREFEAVEVSGAAASGAAASGAAASGAAAPGPRLGVLICTEMWFFEWARSYARAGVELLCIPRATPHASLDKWLAGGRAAAVCAGAWCLSSNPWAPPGGAVDCGGRGWIVSPDGEVLAQTSAEEPFVTLDIDLAAARAAKSTYPRYVAE